MTNRQITAACLLLGTIAAYVLLTPRGGGDGRGRTVIASHSDAGDASIIIHLTGLVLMVPPATAGGRTDVLLPTIADHAALLGFGVTGDEPFVRRLCQSDAGHGSGAIRAGICYVDLDRWLLEPVGAGGQPTPAASTLPATVLNTTAAQGGAYGVHLPALGGELRARVAFAAGQAGGQCSLASWIYEPASGDAGDGRRPLANVVEWEIRNPAARTLVFRSRSGGERIAVPLPAPDADGKIELLLAHIPVEEIGDLPPARPRASALLPDTAHHVDAFYDLLRDRGTRLRPPASNSRDRHLPHAPVVLRPSGCEVGVTVPVDAAEELAPFTWTLALAADARAAGFSAPLPRRSASMTARAGIATYACVVGTGDRS